VIPDPPDGRPDDTARRTAAAAAADLELLLHDVRLWVAQDSPTGDASLVDGMAALLAAGAERYGLDVELVDTPQGRSVHVRVEGRGRARVALIGHHDTVYPRGTAAARPFRIEGGRAYGPGVADMKGGLAVALHAMRLLAGGPRPFARLDLVSVPDEERRNVAFAAMDRIGDADAVLCLECGRVGGEVVSARKGGLWIHLAAHGRSGHAGVDPDQARNAVAALASEVVRIARLHRARPELSVQVTQFSGGTSVNTVPDRALVTVDARALLPEDLDWVTAQILEVGAHDGVAVHPERIERTPPLVRTPAVAALAGEAARLGTVLGLSVGEAATGGASDAVWTAGAGLPSLDGLGPVGGHDHSPAEYVELPSFAARTGLVAGLVHAVDAGLLAGLSPAQSTAT
jgi:glutamate carboxypeptidase